MAPTDGNHVDLSQQKSEPNRLKQFSHRQKIDRPIKGSGNQGGVKVTEMIARQNPGTRRNFPRATDLDPTSRGQYPTQSIHHRPIGQIVHCLFLSDPDKEPEKY